uniref:ORF2a-encoded protein n=1 Tax=Cherry necrotic rusty mottle virus TaxID=129143 RepID=B2KTB7_9VIRU|nr:ORF2a-encoded protein [Cherry necrotic rusty mottle virus]
MLTFPELAFPLAFLLLFTVSLVAENPLSSNLYLIVRSSVLSLTVLLDPQILLGVALKKLYNLYNPDSTFLTSICLDLLTRVLICFFPILIRISANHLLLISLTAILIGLVLRFVNFLIN